MRRRHTPLGALALAAAMCAAPGCDSKAERPASASQTENRPTEPEKPPSARSQLFPHRALLAESARAELEIGGLFIDTGTADQHKFTRGGWRTGWGDNARDEATSFGRVDSRRALLDLDLRRPVTEIVLRARSAARGQTITAHLGNNALGSAKLSADWSVVRIPAAIDPGQHELTLSFGQSRRGGRADIDWIWFAETAEQDPPPPFPRMLTVQIGKVPKRALVAPTDRAYSFYLQPEKGQSLVFDYGSEVGATFTVRAFADGAEPEQLFEAKGTASWQEARIDLAPLAGKAVRLELATTGGQKEGATGWAEPEIMIDAEPEKVDAAGKPAHGVIVILMDTARYDMFEPFAPDNKVRTPTYDGLAKRSTVFGNAYDNENWTKPSVATVLSGVYPSTHDTKRDSSELPRDVKLVSQRLKEDDFATAGFVANGYVSKKFGFDKGWDHFTNYIRENKSSEAEFVYADALQWLEKHKDGRFFLYIQTIDPHVNYKVDRDYTKPYFPDDYDGPLGGVIQATDQAAMSNGKMKYSQRDLDWLKAMYYGEISYHDEHMGKFLEQVEKLGVMDTTALFVTNDHGEELGEHGRFGHGHSLYDAMIRSPLLAHYPPMFPEGGRIDEPVELVDLVPTLLETLGLRPMPSSEGQSLLSLVRGDPVQQPLYGVTEFLDGRRSVRVGNYKFMRSSGDWIHLYDVVDDVNEDNDLLATHPIARRLGEVHLGEALATPDKRQRQQDITTRQKFKAGKAKIGPEVRRQLEALGYFGDHE